MIYTSRFQNPALKSGNYTVVGIVRGLPRFRLGYKLAGNIIDIAPTREMFHINDRAEFTVPYKQLGQRCCALLLRRCKDSK